MIHPTAIVDKKVILGKGVKIGPYAVIDGNVKIGDETEICSYVRIKGDVTIGKENEIYEGAVIGNPPQDIKFKGGKAEVIIGNCNQIKEFVTIHGGEETPTIVGDGNFLMAYVHLAHNCKTGTGVIICNATQVSGCVEIEDYAFVSGLCPIHQFIRIGCYSMIAGGYRVPKDVPPYALVSSDPLRVYSLNIVGLKRHKFPQKTISTLKQAFNILFFSQLNTSQALQRIKDSLSQISEIKHIIEFTEKSSRGIVK